MDDIILHCLLSQLAKDIVLENLKQNAKYMKCEVCEDVSNLNSFKKCVFCSKAFCGKCCGKEGTSICKICNSNIALAVNFPILNQFSVKELKVISDNYRISTRGLMEKSDLVEALLKNFKKTIQGSTSSVVDVEKLKLNMSKMNSEEINMRQKKMEKEMETMKLFSNYENVKRSDIVSINLDCDIEVSVEIEDIPKMSVKELKNLLDNLKVNHSLVLEKNELIDIAKRSMEKYNRLRSMDSKSTDEHGDESSKCSITEKTDKDKLECAICFDNHISCVFFNCAHSNCCFECGVQLENCPMCRQKVTSCVRIYLG